ncbi:MAG: pseudaminic acid biosynthesis-associated methylase [Roseobacter sp.]
MSETKQYATPQEVFWAGDFGDEYITRNQPDRLLIPKVAAWSRMLRSCGTLTSVTELGCNIGLNLLAIKKLLPSSNLSGVEINAKAAKEAKKLDVAEITEGTIVEPLSLQVADLTFTAGVLIHINPDMLPTVYDNLVQNSSRYVLVAEYFDPNPVTINYRGHQDRLFKRDFAGELMDAHGLKLVDYGFFYKRDKLVPQDNITWFLMEK